ncbi:MAG: metallophosphoesterase [Victivallaceae bacterium]|nr:metallophosphoesterase [Victivallaceae bacterium]
MRHLLNIIKRYPWTSTACGVMILLFFWSFYVEPNLIEVIHCEVTPKRWQPEHDGLRMVVLSDMHLRAGWEDFFRRKRIAARVAEQKPDIIVILGDSVNGRGGIRDNISDDEMTAFLAGFKAPLGVWGIFGNHENAYGLERAEAIYKRAGVHLLERDFARIEYKGRGFWLCGLFTYRVGQGSIVPKFPPDEAVIHLLHQAVLMTDFPTWISLTVSGHSHGGQIVLPVIGTAYQPEGIRPTYPDGYSELGDWHLYLTRGLGGSPFSARFLCWPEISVLTLRADRAVVRQIDPVSGQIVAKSVREGKRI